MKYKKLNIIKKERIRVYVRMLKKIHNRCFLALFNGKSTIVIGSRDKDDDMKISLNVRAINSLFKRGDKVIKITLVADGKIENRFSTDIKTLEELDKTIITFLNNKIVEKLVNKV